MKLILSENHELTLSKEQSRDFQDELTDIEIMGYGWKYPILTQIKRLMEA